MNTKQPWDKFELTLSRRDVNYLITVLSEHRKLHSQMSHHLRQLDGYHPESGVLCMMNLDTDPHDEIVKKDTEVIKELRCQLNEKGRLRRGPE